MGQRVLGLIGPPVGHDSRYGIAPAAAARSRPVYSIGRGVQQPRIPPHPNPLPPARGRGGIGNRDSILQNALAPGSGGHAVSGICGWVGEADPAILDAMLSAIAYRGDRTDTAVGPGAALGYRWW